MISALGIMREGAVPLAFKMRLYSRLSDGGPDLEQGLRYWNVIAFINGEQRATAQASVDGCLIYNVYGGQPDDQIALSGPVGDLLAPQRLGLLPAKSKEGALQRLDRMGYAADYWRDPVSDLARLQRFEVDLGLTLSAAFTDEALRRVDAAFAERVTEYPCTH